MPDDFVKINVPPQAALAQLDMVHGDEILWGSEMPAHNFVQISVYRATQQWRLGRAWNHRASSTPIVEFKMSRLQLMNFLLDTNSGEGTPCTLRGVGEEWYPPLAPEDVPEARVLLAQEAQAELQQRIDELGQLMSDVESMSRVGKNAQKDIVHRLKTTIHQMQSNMPFLADCYHEFLQQAQQEAQVELSSYVQTLAERKGIPMTEEIATKLIAGGANDNNEGISTGDVL